MTKLNSRSALILLSIGLLIITSIQILSHYLQLPDLIKGIMTGVGIGILVVALFRDKTNPARTN